MCYEEALGNCHIEWSCAVPSLGFVTADFTPPYCWRSQVSHALHYKDWPVCIFQTLRPRRFTKVEWGLTCSVAKSRRNPETWYTKLSPVTRGSGAEDRFGVEVLVLRSLAWVGHWPYDSQEGRLMACQPQSCLVTPPISRGSLYVRKRPNRWISNLRRGSRKTSERAEMLCSPSLTWNTEWAGGRWKSVLNPVGSHHRLVGVSNQQSIFFRKKPEAEAHTCLAWTVTVVS